MIVAGDEMGRTQRGNNNAYCRDDEVSWVDWQLGDWQQDLLATTRELLRLRRELPVLRQRRFFGGRALQADGTRDLGWFAADGTPMHEGHWHDPHLRTLQALFSGGSIGSPSVLLVLAGSAHDTVVTLPPPPEASSWTLLWNSADEVPGPPTGTHQQTARARARSLRVYVSAP
jgi:glycogen operon protein